MKQLGMILLFLGSLLVMVMPFERIFRNLGYAIPPFWGALFLLVGLLLLWIDSTAWHEGERRR
ncbi:MAG: hypothetical protein HYS14_06315 [Candidatus Rokubacteria bacterium]|nr:hypothetical protein [Candidatus Rokubacteria bacterium]